MVEEEFIVCLEPEIGVYLRQTYGYGGFAEWVFAEVFHGGQYERATLSEIGVKA